MKKLTMFSITALTAFAMTGVPAVTSMAAVFRTGCSPVSGTVYDGSNGSCNILGGNNCQTGGRSSGSVQIFGGEGGGSGLLGNNTAAGTNNCNGGSNGFCQGSICGNNSCGTLGGGGLSDNQILPILPLYPEDLDQGIVLPDQDQNQPGGNQNIPGGGQNQPDGNQNIPGGEDTKPNIPNQEDSFEEQVLELVNEERAKTGAAPLEMDDRALSAADVRAQEIQSSFSHTRPDGSSYSTALSQAGVNFSASGENIAYGQSSAEEVMQVWMNSSGHRANILNGSYSSIGIGHARNSQGVDYWTQLFFH